MNESQAKKLRDGQIIIKHETGERWRVIVAHGLFGDRLFVRLRSVDRPMYTQQIDCYNCEQFTA